MSVRLFQEGLRAGEMRMAKEGLGTSKVKKADCP